MPIIIAKGGRYSARVGSDLADCGFCTSKKLYYYGLKLHILGLKRDNQIPIPDYIAITGASKHDITTLKDMCEELHNIDIYADKAYYSVTVRQDLEDKGVKLLTPIKRERIKLIRKSFFDFNFTG